VSGLSDNVVRSAADRAGAARRCGRGEGEADWIWSGSSVRAGWFGRVKVRRLGLAWVDSARLVSSAGIGPGRRGSERRCGMVGTGAARDVSSGGSGQVRFVVWTGWARLGQDCRCGQRGPGTVRLVRLVWVGPTRGESGTARRQVKGGRGGAWDVGVACRGMAGFVTDGLVAWAGLI
jgi:hypothetical protein